MKINQVAELAGMTSKNIRFYEDQGLIKPRRDPQNGYREYTLEDAKQLEHMATLCRMLSDEVDDVSDIDASAYLDRMKELEKGGVRFVNVRMSDVKKRRTGAILSAIAVIMIAALMLVAVLLANSEDPAPWGMIAVFVIIFGGIIVGVVVALVQRLGEVKRGEIDEASNY